MILFSLSRAQIAPKVREKAAGPGGMCGSSFINRILAKYLKDKLSDDENGVPNPLWTCRDFQLSTESGLKQRSNSSVDAI